MIEHSITLSFTFKGEFFDITANIRLGWKWITVVNYNGAIITVLKKHYKAKPIRVEHLKGF